MNELPDTQAIEDEVALALKTAPFKRPPAPVVDDKNRAAMRNADRHIDTQALQIEAFVDQAIHARIVMTRG